MEVRKALILNNSAIQIKAPAFEDFTKICRVCFKDITESNVCKNIYEEESKIKTLLEVYANAKISETEDSLPQNVCSICIDLLMEIHIFLSRCKVNEDLLIKIRNEAEEIGDSILVQHSPANIEFSTSKTDTSDLDCDNLSLSEGKLDALVNDERMGVFECNYCFLVFISKKELNVHRKKAKHSECGRKPCPHCGKMMTRKAFPDHIRIHTNEKRFACELCNASFVQKVNLIRHMKIHNPEQKNICEICGKSFTRIENLRLHLKLHNPIPIKGNPVQCSECGKLYSSVKKLKIHMRYHANSFLCTDCGKSFTSKVGLSTHTPVHTGEKAFKCLICKRSFTASSSLRRHTATHNEVALKAHKSSSHNRELTHKCTQCDRQFAARRLLIAHLRIHMGKTSHKCTICNKAFANSGVLKRHFRSHNVVKDVKKEHIDEIPELEELQQVEEILIVREG